MADLRRQAAALSAPDTFAQSAKAERRALALEKEAARLRDVQSRSRANYLLTLPRTFRLVGLAGVMFLSLEVPFVARLPAEAAWPLGRWLALGSGERDAGGGGDSGAVALGLLPWALLCHRVSGSMVGRPTR